MTTTVRLEHWTYRLSAAGPDLPRWSLYDPAQGRTVLTFSTEQEARDAAAYHGWTIREDDRLPDVVFGGEGTP